MHMIILGIGFLVAAISAEMVMRGTKLQSGLIQILIVHIIVGAITLLFLSYYHNVRPFIPMMFWCGAWLSWFIVRSHLESSILLRMLSILRRGSYTDEELLAIYEEYYGFKERIKELLEGRLIEKEEGKFILCYKGEKVLKIRDVLCRLWRLS